MQIIQLLLKGRVWPGEFLKLPLALESPHDELLCMYHSTCTFYSNQHCSLKFKFVIKQNTKKRVVTLIRTVPPPSTDSIMWFLIIFQQQRKADNENQTRDASFAPIRD